MVGIERGGATMKKEDTKMLIGLADKLKEVREELLMAQSVIGLQCRRITQLETQLDDKDAYLDAMTNANKVNERVEAIRFFLGMGIKWEGGKDE